MAQGNSGKVALEHPPESIPVEEFSLPDGRTAHLTIVERYLTPSGEEVPEDMVKERPWIAYNRGDNSSFSPPYSVTAGSVRMRSFVAAELLEGASSGDWLIDWRWHRYQEDIPEESWSVVQWPAIYDPETEEYRPIKLPSQVFQLRHGMSILAAQRGPFLRIVDLEGGCLPLMSEASSEAEELACVVERVLLTDLGDVITDEGVTWHRVRTPAGIEGWADGRYLE